MDRLAVRRPGGGQQDHRTLLALGLGDQLVHRALARRPVAPGGPAIVDDQQQRPAARQRRPRVQQRPGQGQDDQRRHDQTQQQKPPGRAGRRLLPRGQVAQQADGGKLDGARRRRRDAQQPPQDRQGGQCGQDPGGGEGDRSETQHWRVFTRERGGNRSSAPARRGRPFMSMGRRPPLHTASMAIAPQRVSSADCGERSVRWTAKLQPAVRASAARPSCCAFRRSR